MSLPSFSSADVILLTVSGSTSSFNLIYIVTLINQSREGTTIITSTYICCVLCIDLSTRPCMSSGYQAARGKWLIACPKSVQSFRSQLDVQTSSPSQSFPDLQSTFIRSLSVWCYHFRLLAFWLLAQATFPPSSRPHGSSQYPPHHQG